MPRQPKRPRKKDFAEHLNGTGWKVKKPKKERNCSNEDTNNSPKREGQPKVRGFVRHISTQGHL